MPTTLRVMLAFHYNIEKNEKLFFIWLNIITKLQPNSITIFGEHWYKILLRNELYFVFSISETIWCAVLQAVSK